MSLLDQRQLYFPFMLPHVRMLPKRSCRHRGGVDKIRKKQSSLLLSSCCGYVDPAKRVHISTATRLSVRLTRPLVPYAKPGPGVEAF